MSEKNFVPSIILIISYRLYVLSYLCSNGFHFAVHTYAVEKHKVHEIRTPQLPCSAFSHLRETSLWGPVTGKNALRTLLTPCTIVHLGHVAISNSTIAFALEGYAIMQSWLVVPL
jgi:hypothetical protein